MISDNIIKRLLKFSSFLNMLAFGYTTPIIWKYFIELIDATVLATANIIGLLLSMISTKITATKYIATLDNIFPLIVLADSLLYILSCIYGYEYPEYRFYLLNISSGLSIVIWNSIMKYHINRRWHGDTLFFTNQEIDLYLKAGSLFGALLVIIYTLPIIESLIISSIACILYGIIEIYTWYLLRKDEKIQVTK